MQLCSDLGLATCGGGTLSQDGYDLACIISSFLVCKVRSDHWSSLNITVQWDLQLMVAALSVKMAMTWHVMLH